MKKILSAGMFALASATLAGAAIASEVTQPVSVSEPGTLALLATGVVAAILLRRRGGK